MIDGLGTLALVALGAGYVFADTSGPSTAAVELQAFKPTQVDRQLNLSNANWTWARRTLFDERLEFRLGLTLSRATGSIIQSSGSLADGSFRQQTLDSAAWGLGPTISARLSLIQSKGVLLSVDTAASLMHYDKSFPAGGSKINGMLQAGPTLSWQSGPAGQWSLGVRWVHVSNGQGLGAHNPSYDGRGAALQYQRPLRGLLSG